MIRKIVAILVLFGFGALGGPVFCPGGLERFLPGQYDFCESVRSAAISSVPYGRPG